MKIIFNKKWCGFIVILLIATFSFQNAMADKIKPTIDISKTGFGGTDEPETFLNNHVFAEPVITLYEDEGKTINITNRFYISYAMQNGIMGKDEEGKDISTDKETGTYVYTRYGEVVTGGKAGIATVCVTMTPISKYTELYETAKCTYRITLNKVTATAKRTCPEAEIWKAAYNYTIAYPTFTMSYQDQNGKSVDVSPYYDIKATSASQLISLDTTNKRITTKDQEGKADITFSFIPKSDTYQAVADQTLTLNIVKLDKITPQLIFPEEGDSAYFGITDWKCTIPKVIDDFGNDLGWRTTKGGADVKGDLLLAWGANPLKEGATMHTTPTYCSSVLVEEPYRFQEPEPGKTRQPGWGGIQVNDFDFLNTGNPAYYENVPRNEFVTYNPYSLWGTAKMADYNSKIYCQIYPNPYKQDIISRFNKSESYYNFKVMTRKCQIVIEPDPRYVKFTQGEKMDISTRFHISALHVATVDDSQLNMKKGEQFWLRHSSESNGQDGMNYTVKFRSDEVKIDGYVGGDNNIKKITDENGIEYTIFWSTKGYNNDNNWTLTFLKTGKINIEYAVYPYNYHWDGDGYGKTTITFDVMEKVQPQVVETPNPIILYTTDTQLPAQPEVSITDLNGNDIKNLYDIQFEIQEKDLHGIQESNGCFSISTLTKGEVNVKVIATPKDGNIDFQGVTRPIKEVYEKGQTSFKFIIKELEEGQTRFNWDIIDTQSEGKDYASAYDKDHGKLYFTKEGTVTAGYTIDAIPGLAVKFGNDQDDDWTALKDKDGRIYVSGSVVKISDKGIPQNGTYYELTPHTNGFLTIDAHVAKNNKLVILTTTGKEVQYLTANTDITGEIGNATWQYAENKTVGYPHDNVYKFFRYPLMAGNTYYLYNEGDEASREPLHIYGINFLPAFINQQTDHMPITSATAFANGYAGALPMLTAKDMRGYKGVEYKKAGIKLSTRSQNIDELDEYAEINPTLGTIIPKRGTISQFAEGQDNISINSHKALSTIKDRIKIYGVVKSNYKPNVVKTPFYDLMISDIPSFIMPEGYVPNVGEIVSTTNYETRIKAYFGGWRKADDRPYFKSNVKENGALTDSWKISKLDSVGASNRTVDYFTYSSFGGQNATTELVKSYKYNSDDEDMTYQLPCRGTYLRFEAEEKGTLVVYILQNGMITYDGDKQKLSNLSKKYDKIKISPVYITDENGLPVKLQPWSISKYDDAAQGTEAYTEGIVNCDYNTWKNDCNGGNDCSQDNMSATAQDEKKYTLDLLERIGYVAANSTIKMGDPEKVIDVAKELGKPESEYGSMGYTILSKAYTRYSFKVEAGKTYFVFMNGSKLGNGGFAFMPEDWQPNRSKDAIEIQNVTLDENGGANDDLASNKIESGKTAKVKLYHKFTAKRWNSICVPFSINQTKFKQIFGDDALAISFDKFEKNKTIDGEVFNNVAYFTQHSYHWIVAGRPYLILPGKDFKAKTDDNGRQYIEIDSVTIEKEKTPMHLKEQNAKAEFNFNGNYSPITLEKGDYAIASKQNGEAQLWELPQQMPQKGYRAYIKTTQEAIANNAKLSNFYFGEIKEGSGKEETTDIQPIFELPASTNTKMQHEGVYTLNGIRIEGSNAELCTQPKDIYIVNGKKVVNKK